MKIRGGGGGGGANNGYNQLAVFIGLVGCISIDYKSPEPDHPNFLFTIEDIKN